VKRQDLKPENSANLLGILVCLYLICWRLWADRTRWRQLL